LSKKRNFFHQTHVTEQKKAGIFQGRKKEKGHQIGGFLEKNSSNRGRSRSLSTRLGKSPEAKKLASGSKEGGRRVGFGVIEGERKRLVIGSGGGGIERERRGCKLGCSERHFGLPATKWQMDWV